MRETKPVKGLEPVKQSARFSMMVLHAKPFYCCFYRLYLNLDFINIYQGAVWFILVLEYSVYFYWGRLISCLEFTFTLTEAGACFAMLLGELYLQGRSL